MAEWVRALAWAGDRTVSRPGSNPATVTSLRNFGNSVYPALPVSFGGDTKSRRSLLSGVYARGSKISHQSALECVTVVDSYHHPLLNSLTPRVRLCGGKRCPALVSEEEEEAIIYSDKQKAQIEKHLNNDMEIVKTWLDENKLTLNVKKKKHVNRQQNPAKRSRLPWC